MTEKEMERKLIILAEHRQEAIAAGDGWTAEKLREQYRALHPLFLAARAKRLNPPAPIEYGVVDG